MKNSALIQVQDITGNWVTVTTTANQDQIIFRNLESVAKQYKRMTRAIDSFGNLLQIKN